MFVCVFFGVDDFEMYIYFVCYGGEMVIVLYLFCCIGKLNVVVVVMIVDWIIGVFGQFFIKCDGMGFQFDYCLVYFKVCYLCGGVLGCF